MRTEIYYFSGTGNSLHVAKELQKRLPDTDLIPILSLINKDTIITTGTTVGFVCPHYASTLPKIVRTFIKKLNMDSAEYLFAIVTRGRTETMAFLEIDKILKGKRRRLDSFFAITMPSGSEPLVKGYTDRITDERILRLESEMLERLDTIQSNILNREVSRIRDTGDGTRPPSYIVPFLPLLRLVTPLLVRFGKLVETSFDLYHDGKCTGCGLCEEVCLAKKIQMDGEYPVWRETIQCQGCFACLNFCPLESIQVRSKFYLRSYTPQNGRYHHRDITAKEIAAQKIDSKSR
ncbi:MAG: EFR1 family ferrodoxin [Dehalococcoidales bacterium]|nr:MAG: EFR1 family ferrodoxin [Dehalococcoidales bacterium]